MRASQRSTSDDEFVRLFGVGALEVIKSFDDPWNGLVFLRSAPGGGKTTFLRILTPRPLKLTDNLADQHQQVKATRDALREVGAIGRDGPKLLGAMVVFTSEYKELSAFDRGNILFRELLNSRIVVATLRSVLERAERQFPDDLDQYSFEWEPESDATIPGRATGKELFTWASRIERDFYDRMDDLGSPASIKGGHARLDGLKWFAHAVVHAAPHDEIHLHLGVPMWLQHHQWTGVKHLQEQRQAFHAAGAWLVKRPFRHLTFRQFRIPFVGDKPSALHSLAGLAERANEMGGFQCASH